jgi:hypothetical protein
MVFMDYLATIGRASSAGSRTGTDANWVPSSDHGFGSVFGQAESEFGVTAG